MIEEVLRKFIEEHGGYWEGECKLYPIASWRQNVCNGSTRMGYWEWAFDEVDTYLIRVRNRD